MWPKALLELLPHLTRLVPMLNRYFQSRGANDEATRIAIERKLDEVSTALRKDISEASAALPSADISRQLTQHGKALIEVATGVRAIQSDAQSVAARITTLEKRNATLTLFVVLSLILVLGTCILSVLILVKLHK